MRASVGFNVCVGEKMRFQIASLVEAPPTSVTFVRRLIHVQNPVDSQSSALAETFPTVIAFEWLVLAMNVPTGLDKLSLYTGV